MIVYGPGAADPLASKSNVYDWDALGASDEIVGNVCDCEAACATFTNGSTKVFATPPSGNERPSGSVTFNTTLLSKRFPVFCTVMVPWLRPPAWIEDGFAESESP